MGRKRSRSRSRQPSAPPARRRRRRSSARPGRSRSEPKKTPVAGKIARRTDLPPSKPNKETRVPSCKPRGATGRKRARSRTRDEPPAQPAGGAGSRGRRRDDGPYEVKITSIFAKRTGRLRGQAVRRPPPLIPRPGTPPLPPEKRAAFRDSPSPEPAEEEQPAAAATPPAEAERRRDREKALYLVVQEQCHGNGVVAGYAVHRVGLARSPHGISVTGEELEAPPVARFKAAPGMSFFKAGSASEKKIVGVTGKGGAGAVEAESVVIDAGGGTWEVSAGPPPPSSAECGLVEVSGKIFAADMLAEEHPRCEVLRRSVSAGWSWSPLPRPPFRGRIVKLAAYPPCRGLLASTDKGETYLFDRRRRRGRDGSPAWVALHGSPPLPFGERAVYAKGQELWFEVSPADGRLRAHGLDVVPGAGAGAAPRLVHAAHRVSDPIPVITLSTPSAKLVYLGRGNFCAAQAGGDAERGDARAGGGCRVTVTVFRAVDSGMPAERRRWLRERGVNARWIAELERAMAVDAAASGRRRRKLCRVNLWSRTYIVRVSGAGEGHGPSLAGVVWM